MARPNMKPVAPAAAAPAGDAFFNPGFTEAFEAQTGARNAAGVQCTAEGEEVRTWINAGSSGKDVASFTPPVNDAIYRLNKIDGAPAVGGDGNTQLLNTTLGDSMSRVLFTFLTRVRFDAGGGVQAFWPRHSNTVGASFLEYTWATSTLLFRNLNATPFGSRNFSLVGIPQDEDLTIAMILANGFLTGYVFDQVGAVIGSGITPYVDDFRANAMFTIFAASGQIAMNMKKAVWYNSDESADLLRLERAMRLTVGFPLV